MHSGAKQTNLELERREISSNWELRAGQFAADKSSVLGDCCTNELDPHHSSAGRAAGAPLSVPERATPSLRAMPAPAGAMGAAARRDRGWAWVVLLAAFFCNVAFDGIIFSFGFFYLDFLLHFRRGRGATAWIGSVLSAVYALVGEDLDIALNFDFLAAHTKSRWSRGTFRAFFLQQRREPRVILSTSKTGL